MFDFFFHIIIFFSARYLLKQIHYDFESIKTLEIKTSKLFDVDFANNTILSSFFFSFLIIDLYFNSYCYYANL